MDLKQLLTMLQSVSGPNSTQRLAVEQFLGATDNSVGNEILRCATCFHLHQLAEIASRKVALLGKVSHCRNAVGFGLFGQIIV